MKKITLNNGEVLKVVTEIDELTFLEVEMFKQFFAKILYDIDLADFERFKDKMFESLDNHRFAEAIITLQNFYQTLKLQDISKSGWVICFALLVKKDKPTLIESELFEIYNEIAVKGIKNEDFRTVLESFFLRFPNLSKVYKLKVEKLTMLDMVAHLS